MAFFLLESTDEYKARDNPYHQIRQHGRGDGRKDEIAPEKGVRIIIEMPLQVLVLQQSCLLEYELLVFKEQRVKELPMKCQPPKAKNPIHRCLHTGSKIFGDRIHDIIHASYLSCWS